MDYEAQKEWFQKHPGIRCMIVYATGEIIFWLETKKKKIVRTEAYSLSAEELKQSWKEKAPILEKYYAKFMKREAE